MVQDYELSDKLNVIDNASKENLENLEKVGQELLTKKLLKLNLETGEHEPYESGITNEEALKR